MSSSEAAQKQSGRSEVIKVYMTPEEKRRVQQLAKELECSMSEVMQISDPNRSRDPVCCLRRRVDVRMLNVQLHRLLERMEGAGGEPMPDGRPLSGNRLGVAFGEALIADVRDLISAAQEALAALPPGGVPGDPAGDAEGMTDAPQRMHR